MNQFEEKEKIKNKCIEFLNKSEKYLECAKEKNEEIKEKQVEKLKDLQNKIIKMNKKIENQMNLIVRINKSLERKYLKLIEESNFVIQNNNNILQEFSILLKKLKEKEIRLELISTKESLSFEKKTLFDFINFESVQKLINNANNKLKEIIQNDKEFKEILVLLYQTNVEIEKKRIEIMKNYEDKNEFIDFKNYNSEKISEIKLLISEIYTIFDNLNFLDKIPNEYNENIFFENEFKINKIINDFKNSNEIIKKKINEFLMLFKKNSSLYESFDNYYLNITHFSKKIDEYEANNFNFKLIRLVLMKI